MMLYGTLLATVLPAIVFARSSFVPVIKNNTEDSLKRLKRCYSNSWSNGGYYNPCCYTQNNWCQSNACYPYYDPCSTYPPATYPPATYPPTYLPIWPTVFPNPTTRPPYTPIWPTVSPYPTRPTYIPIWPTVSPYPTPIWQTRTPAPTTRPAYTPIWQTRTPAYTPVWQTRTPNPTYDPIWQTRTPNPTYIPIWQTRTPNPTYDPIWQTRTPNPTYDPIWQTRTPNPTYNPIWQTRTPNPTYIPIWQTRTPNPTYIPIWQTQPTVPTTRPAYTPIGQTRPVITTRPTYIPIGQTVDPITTRPTFIPIWVTKPPKALRQNGTEVTAAVNKPRSLVAGQPGCKQVCIDERQMVYCCENDNSECPVIDKALCEEESEGLSFRNFLGDNCTIDSHCQANSKCCYNFCDDEYYCMKVHEWNNISPLYAMDDYYQYGRLQRHTGSQHWNLEVAIVFPVESSDSMALLENLTSLVAKFHNHINLNLFPIETQVGATDITESLGMGEIIQCAANQYPDQRTLLKLTTCLMTSDLLQPNMKLEDAQSAARMCGRHAGYRWRLVSACVKEKKGRQLLVAAKRDHKELFDGLQKKHLSSIFQGSPIMALNGTVLSTPPQVSVDWLVEEICKHLRHLPDIPSLCNDTQVPSTDVESR